MASVLDAHVWVQELDAVAMGSRRGLFGRSRVEHPGGPDAVLALNETGFLREDTKSVGVQRQHSDTASRIAPWPIGVFLGHARPHGPALIRPVALPAGELDRASI